MNKRSRALLVCWVWGWAVPVWALSPLGPDASAAPPRGGVVFALQSTLRLHPAVRAKRAEVDAKRFAGEAARAQRYPSLSTQWAVQNGMQPGSVRARQPIWTFGRIDSAIGYADADALAEDLDLLRVQRNLLDQVAAAYARAWGAGQRWQVGTDNLAELQTLFDKIVRREGGQLASAADVGLAQSRLTQGQVQRDRLATEWRLAQMELEALAQQGVESAAKVPEDLLALGQARSMADWLADVPAQHADVRLRDGRVRVTEADIEREQRAAMPGVFLQVDRSFRAGNTAARTGGVTTYGVVLEAGLDNLGLATRGRLRGAVARREAALADKDSVLVEVRRTVQSLYVQRETQRQMRASQARSVLQIERLLASYQRQYEAGYKSWLEVLNMQRELTEQRLLAVQADTDWQAFSLRLSVLLGDLDGLSGLAVTGATAPDVH